VAETRALRDRKERGLKVFFEIRQLVKAFGGLVAVSEFNMSVKQGEIVGLIGPNGAGKSTLFNLVTGVFAPTSGQVIFDDRDITGMKPHRVARLGIGRTFQLNPLFGDFSVLQNVSASFHLHPRSSMLSIYFNTPAYRRNEALIAEQSLEVLRLVGLEHVRNELAKNLPHGYQKMLGVARALATRPKLLLLDEPLGGMNPEEIDFTLEAVKKTRDQGMTILMVEHNMQILDLCDRVVVISFGQKICEGLPKEVRENEQVIRAYFGGEHAA
jgi:branched-chain amino acid transport system ATP-binding protein